MSSPYKPRGRGRGGYNDNRDGRSSGGNSGGRSFDGNSGSRYYERNSGNRGAPGIRGNFRGRGQGNRGGHHESRNMVDTTLIGSQNVKWDYESRVRLVKPEFVKRNGYLSDGRKIALMTNHFSFDFSANGNIYHYHFTWSDDFKDKEKKQLKEKKLDRLLCYQLFDAVMKQHQQYFNGVSVGYDGSANVYSSRDLAAEANDLSVSDVLMDGKPHNFSVKLELVKTIPLKSLEEYYGGSEMNMDTKEMIQGAIQALHIILKFPARYNMIALGRLAMFPIDAERYYLSDWVELALGHRKSLRFSEIGLTLVVDRASAAFLKSGEALDFMKYVISMEGRPLSEFKPNPYQIYALAMAFAHVKVSTEHLGFTKKYTVKTIAEKAACHDKFEITENATKKEITVQDYFKDKYKLQLKYPNLPCIVTTNGSKIPIEICKIVADQSLHSIKKDLNAKEQANMIRQTATAPDVRFTCLLKANEQICEQVNNEDLQDFNIKIGVKPIGVEGIVLNAPRLLYCGQELTPRDGAWNLQGKIFFNKATFDNFGVLNFCAFHGEDMPFCSAFIDKAFEMGMTANRNRMPLIRSIMNYQKISKNDLTNMIAENLTEMKRERCSFALCIFPEDKYIYNLTKKIADIDLHFPTQGVSLINVQKRSVQTIANILAKVNKKLGGVNVILKEKPTLLKEKIMIIGADVTHPGERDALYSSVAASVSTYDSNHTLFFPSVRVQPKKNVDKKIVEIIKDFRSMIQEHLNNYKEKNHSLPTVILYLRDGVSDGQYAQIFNEEVKHLRNPYGDDYKPKVTAVIISKRILTRARPIDQKDGVGNNFNVPPGTTIDRIITHPSDFDYFQYGHKGIKGTSRPCHYYMVHDDNNLTVDKMAKISYHLCHLFERATSSTSAPAPVMHAHNLAFKARQWICSTDTKLDLKKCKDGKDRFREEEKIARILNEKFSKINVDYARSSMFYI